YNLAKYWKGYYLMSGYYVKKDVIEALKFFKEAADGGVTDAQLRYAFLLMEQQNYDVKVVLDYLTRAANTGNATALYNLGDVYLHGKLGEQKDTERGMDLIKLAALKGQPSANEDLNKF
ncbi:3451_t:CDS:1, partial [Acaulospora morrowiae]